MKLMKKSILMVCLIPVLAFAEIIIDLQLFNTSADILYVGDLDFTNPGSTPNIYMFTIQNVNEPPQLVRLSFQMIKDNQVIAQAESNPFVLAPGGPHTATQQQVNTGTFFVPDDNGQPQTVELRDYIVLQDVASDFQDKVIATGKFPSGTYDFSLEIVFENDPGRRVQDVNPNNNIIIVTNPSVLELLFPGRPVYETEIPEINTLFPFLQWQADAVFFNVFVYEKYSDDRTVQDVLSHPPILELRNYPEQRLQYPLNSSPVFPGGGEIIGPVRLLEAGKIYYWYVQAVMNRVSGFGDFINSEVYHFKIADVTQSNFTSEQILRYLQQLLGPEYAGLLKKLLDEGYTPNGNIFYEGNPVDIIRLPQILQQFSQGNARIRQVEIY